MDKLTVDPLDIEFALTGNKLTDEVPFEERFIGCPIWWLQRVRPLTESAAELIVAEYVWRRHVVVGRRTFSLSNGELKALGVDRSAKYRMLVKLRDAGLISLSRQGREAPVVTILARKRRRRSA